MKRGYTFFCDLSHVMFGRIKHFMSEVKRFKCEKSRGNMCNIDKMKMIILCTIGNITKGIYK